MPTSRVETDLPLIPVDDASGFHMILGVYGGRVAWVVAIDLEQMDGARGFVFSHRLVRGVRGKCR
jgi:hypothetical protein